MRMWCGCCLAERNSEVNMKLKNVLIVVNDMERSIRFYKELFGLQVILDQDGNVQLSMSMSLWNIAGGKR